MAKDLEVSYLLDFYGKVLTEKQRDALQQYYYNDFSLSEIAENLGITRQGVRDAIKHGEASLLELEEKVGFAARYRAVEEKLETLQDLIVTTKNKQYDPYNVRATEYCTALDEMQTILRTIDLG